MLVYANNLRFVGTKAEEVVFKAIGAWLKEQVGFGLHPDQLRRDGEYEGVRGTVRSSLRVYSTEEDTPRLYSWVLRFPDENVYGRRWVAEAGVKATTGSLELSCVVKVDESSTLAAAPVTASQPRLIRYVIKNIQAAPEAQLDNSIVGIAARRVGTELESYRSLLEEIDSPQRIYPIVLVSPTRAGTYLIEAPELQRRLVGLAQVIEVAKDFDSYEMTRILGKQKSAWGGAINILQPPTHAGIVRGRYFLADAIEGWGSQNDRSAHILAWVTNTTNLTQLLQHVRPEGVMQLALRRKMQIARARSEDLNPAQIRQALDDATRQVAEQARLADELLEEMARLENALSDTKAELEDAIDTLGRREYDIQALKDQLGRASGASIGAVDIEALLELASRNDCPSPSDCLAIIERLYGDKCIILPSAKKSAENSHRFVYGRQLLDMLRRLVTEYRDKLISGGDSEARKVFGKNEFAAKESETVMNNGAMKRERQFEYDGNQLYMFRHLKIGVDDDATKTIRVHFHWDSAKQKVIIGYCGGHLTISSR